MLTIVIRKITHLVEYFLPRCDKSSDNMKCIDGVVHVVVFFTFWF